MKALEDAQAYVIAAIQPLGTSEVPLAESLGRVVAQPVVVREPMPPFDNSAMDGYAVLAADVTQVPVRLTVLEDVAAGSVPTEPIVVGTATRIMTGAPMPRGADAVVKVEDTSSPSRDEVVVASSVRRGDNVRLAGGDMKPGDVIVVPGTRLTSRHLATLASAGIDPVVSDLPTVAVMSTGDEIVDPSTPVLKLGTIRDSNRVMLMSMLNELGVPVLDLGIIGDDPRELRSAYETAADGADVIVSTGGVSMGDSDYVKQILSDLGGIEFWKVAMQPGKPFAFGAVNGVPLFGLPGNPVSTFVSFEQFVRPALLTMMGARYVMRTHIEGTMGEDVTTSSDRRVFLRVHIEMDDQGSFIAHRSGAQGSNMHLSLSRADAFAVIPVGVGSLSAGDHVTLEMFRWPEGRGFND